ncbi:MAG: aquaporin [Actinomycetota bacterium]
MEATLVRKAVAEFVGTALLLGAALGGGQAATAQGASSSLALLIGTLAAAATLFTVLHAIGPISGGHVNPAVTISMLVTRELRAPEAAAYIGAQLVGGFVGAMGANALWEASLILGPGSGSLGTASYVAEMVATCGLVGAIHAAVRGGNAGRLPMIVPAAVMAASFTAPFGMANPAVALAAGVVGGGLPIDAIILLIGLELMSAALIANGVAMLYGGSPTPEADDLTFDVHFGRAMSASPEVVTEAIRAALRADDHVIPTCDGGWRVVLADASDEVVEAVRHRISAFVELALDVEQMGSRPIEANFVPVGANGDRSA